MEPRDVAELEPERREDLVLDLEQAIEDKREELIDVVDRLHAYEELKDVAEQIGRDLGRERLSLDDLIAYADGDPILRARIEGLGRRIAG
jgi:hypothetical protein